MSKKRKVEILIAIHRFQIFLSIPICLDPEIQTESRANLYNNKLVRKHRINKPEKDPKSKILMMQPPISLK